MSTDIEQIRDRLRRLRAMTVENGCTEAEAAIAAICFSAFILRSLLSEDPAKEKQGDGAGSDARKLAAKAQKWPITRACRAITFVLSGPIDPFFMLTNRFNKELPTCRTVS